MNVKSFLNQYCPNFYAWLQYKNRIRVIKAHSRMSDDEQLKQVASLYKEKTGHDLNYGNPRRYTEKIQWRKMFGLDHNMALLSDKFAVREWVSDKLGPEYLIPLIGAWESVDDIDWDALPQSFVLKTNNASGTNLIVPDRSKLNLTLAKKTLSRWMKMRYGWLTFEKQYLDIKPMVIAEKYMKDAKTDELNDYKFLCFDGAPKFVWVDCDRQVNHRRAVFDLDWRLVEWNQLNYGLPTNLPPKPDCFDEMKKCAQILSAGFPHVRVDFYDINGRVYFGEMTFTNGSGYECIYPDEYDFKLGELWNEPK